MFLRFILTDFSKLDEHRLEFRRVSARAPSEALRHRKSSRVSIYKNIRSNRIRVYSDMDRARVTR